MTELIKRLIGKVLPEPIQKRLKEANLSIKIRRVQGNHQKTLDRIRKKEKVRVVFFLIHDSIWKYEGVYKLMEQDERFDPIVVVCPYIIYGEENMLREMESSFNSFKVRGYNVICSYNEDTNDWLDVKKQIKPDIVFFTNPYKLTKNEYYITNYLSILTVYVPYSYTITHRMDMAYDTLLHNFAWKVFYESDSHKQMAIINALNKGRNVVVSGYPGLDFIKNPDYGRKKVWKENKKNLKKIIWAPHHTIDDDKDLLSFSNFKRYHQFFLDIAVTYKNEIQIAFKPHPLLKYRLILDEDWGKEKTESYYFKWNEGSNLQLEEKDYENLFLSSDAMIHDSGSFMVEYLATTKPALFTIRDENLSDRLNSFGKKVFDLHYHANEEKDILDFIKNVVIKETDDYKTKRYKFINKYIFNQKNISASKFIYNYINQKVK